MQNNSQTVKEFDLEQYLNNGVEKVVKQLLKTSAFHPRESLFMAKYALASKRSSALRKEAEERGEHVPAFLIASITSMCNLHCVGCYARSLETCVDGEPVQQMSADDWDRVFNEAKDIGVGFILLAGGEPMVRRDVILKAAEYPEILFPIFTNGTMLDDEYLDLFDKYRNLIPIVSMEGGAKQTDSRRGNGMYQKVQDAMKQMTERRIAFGVSITVTSKNMTEVTSENFIHSMALLGCKAVIYVEFVPTNEALNSLALNDAARSNLADRISDLRNMEYPLLMLSFPGDEKGAGGCLAAGRGFFHINSHGGAEPCPFSPYSDINVKEHSLKNVLNSELLRALRENEILTQEHDGGCVLFQNRHKVEALLKTK